MVCGEREARRTSCSPGMASAVVATPRRAAARAGAAGESLAPEEKEVDRDGNALNMLGRRKLCGTLMMVRSRTCRRSNADGEREKMSLVFLGQILG